MRRTRRAATLPRACPTRAFETDEGIGEHSNSLADPLAVGQTCPNGPPPDCSIPRDSCCRGRKAASPVAHESLPQPRTTSARLEQSLRKALL